MVEVQFFDPGEPVPNPTRNEGRHFDFSTRKDFKRKLESLAESTGRPVFFAIESGDLQAIGVAAVHRVLSAEDGEVQLSKSHARHQVDPRVQPLKVGDWYEMAIDPASNVILTARHVAPLPVRPTSQYPIDLCALPAVSPSRAEIFFSSVRRQPHIPFQLPANGCWARAHEMIRLIEGFFDPNPQSVVAKIWNRGNLIVETDNNPECAVGWGYHVAPAVKVDGRMLVIDPALFERPVSVKEWRNAQTDLLSHEPLFTTQQAYDLFDFEAKLFYREEEGETESDLQNSWGQLIAQLYAHGPLPYPCRKSP
jgi:hypothetical protein